MQARHSFRVAVKLPVYMPVALKLDSAGLCAALLVVGVTFRNATYSLWQLRARCQVDGPRVWIWVGGVVEAVEKRSSFFPYELLSLRDCS